MSILNLEQGTTLIAVTRLVRCAYEAQESVGVTPKDWEFWQGMLITTNAVTRMVNGKEQIDWRDIRLVCEYAATILHVLPSTHNAHEMIPVAILDELLELAEGKGAA